MSQQPKKPAPTLRDGSLILTVTQLESTQRNIRNLRSDIAELNSQKARMMRKLGFLTQKERQYSFEIMRAKERLRMNKGRRMRAHKELENTR